MFQGQEANGLNEREKAVILQVDPSLKDVLVACCKPAEQSQGHAVTLLHEIHFPEKDMLLADSSGDEESEGV